MNLRELAEAAWRDHDANQWPPQLAALAGLLPPLHRVLEIGTERGGTAWFWSQITEPGAEILTIDVEDRRGLHAERGVRFLRGDSRDPAIRQAAGEFFSGPLDFLYIDGDHDHETVRSDFETYRDLVRPGGVVAFDDITHPAPSVSVFWDQLAGQYRRLSIIPSSEEGAGKVGDRPGVLLGIGAVLL